MAMLSNPAPTVPPHNLASNQTASDDNVGLFAASASGDIQEMRRLLKSSGNPNYRNQKEGGKTAFHAAVASGILEPVTLLLDTILNEDGIAKETATFPAVIDIKDTVGGDTPLHIAASGGFLTSITALVGRNAPINAPNQLGNTPLHVACSTNQTLAARELIIAGADIKALNKRGSTVLLFAIYGLPAGDDTVGLISLLIEGGVDVNAQDSNGTTALHAAASKGYLKVAEKLLDSGANVTLKDVAGKDAQHYARVRGFNEVFHAINAIPRDEVYDNKMVEIINAN